LLLPFGSLHLRALKIIIITTTKIIITTITAMPFYCKNQKKFCPNYL